MSMVCASSGEKVTKIGTPYLMRYPWIWKRMIRRTSCVPGMLRLVCSIFFNNCFAAGVKPGTCLILVMSPRTPLFLPSTAPQTSCNNGGRSCSGTDNYRNNVLTRSRSRVTPALSGCFPCLTLFQFLLPVMVGGLHNFPKLQTWAPDEYDRQCEHKKICK